MNAIERDAARRFQGDRFGAVYPAADDRKRCNRKRLAVQLGVSRQAADHKVTGKVAAIRYDELARLAEDPNANPETIPLGALELIEAVRASTAGDLLEMAERADEWMTKAQAHDGREDCDQLTVKAVLASLAFVHDSPSLPFRRKAVEALRAWQACKRAEMAADMAALGYVAALVRALEPAGGR